MHAYLARRLRKLKRLLRRRHRRDHKASRHTELNLAGFDLDTEHVPRVGLSQKRLGLWVSALVGVNHLTPQLAQAFFDLPLDPEMVILRC